MKTNKTFIIELSNSQEMKLLWDSWNQKWLGHVSYWGNVDKLNDPILGVNAIANAVAHSAKNNQYALKLEDLILTISVYDFKQEYK